MLTMLSWNEADRQADELERVNQVNRIGDPAGRTQPDKAYWSDMAGHEHWSHAAGQGTALAVGAAPSTISISVSSPLCIL